MRDAAVDGVAAIADTCRMYPADGADAPAPDSAAAAPAADVFAAVPVALRRALQQRGFAQLTEVQAAVLAADDGERDLRISSQTGSGKTVALGLALAARVGAGERGARTGPTTLVVAPTRELAAQVKEELTWLFADLPGVRCEVVTGGTNIARERMQLPRRPAVVVGTPGRLLDHVRNQVLDLGGVRQLVLDEADQMLDLGFKDELDAILEALPAERRTHLVSATFPPSVKALADRFQKNALMVAGTPAGAAHADIEHIALKIASREHYAALVNLLLLAGDERTLVFVRTREDTQGLADKLAGDGFLAMPIHGDLAQSQRTRTLQAFRRGAIHTLIATDVAARGLDIADVTTVVHADPPIDAETYVHRSGRTGRAGQKGRSYMLVVKTRANFVRRLYHGARVEASWEGPPGAAEVRAVQHARAGAKAAVLLTQGTKVAPELQALARQLLQDRDPAQVVAALLANAATGVCEPFEVKMEREVAPSTSFAPQVTNAPVTASAVARELTVKVPVGKHSASEDAGVDDSGVDDSGAGESGAEDAGADRPTHAHTPAHGGKAHHASAGKPVFRLAPHVDDAPAPQRRLAATQRGRAGAPPAWRREAPAAAASGHGQSFARFRINWGGRDGADPRRILAHVCRRGDIDGKLVGSIEVHPSMTTFAVAVEVAAEFERRAQRPDRRDPHLVISRDRFGSR